MNHKSFLFWSIIGALAGIFALNYFLNMTYTSEGSWDIVSGALVETFVLTCFYQYFEARQTKRENNKTQQQHKQIISRLEDLQNHISKTTEAYHMQTVRTLQEQEQQPYTVNTADRIQAQSDEMAAPEWEAFKQQIKSEMLQRGVNDGN